jgi:(1->4)-alpha-D-glucan 1-alpha-D-glucosylmutase
MSSEINVLARELNRISEMNRHSRDYTLGSLRRALVEFVALFPVYRSYVDDWRSEIDQRDIHYIEWTIRRAKEMDLATNASIYDFLKNILLRRYAEHVTASQRAVMLRFTMKLQQLTGPVMAKGLEDTVFYIYNRFIALNEVGGEPERFGAAVETFHLRNQERAEKWPAALLATSTHDTKRGEDARARLNVLSEIPLEWHKRILRWARLNAKFKAGMPSGAWPDSNDEYLYYQALLGAWPMGATSFGTEWDVFINRMREYMTKAIREAKVHTSWVNPDTEYESAVSRFVEQTLNPSHRRFLDDIAEFKLHIEWPGQINSLAQLVLKLSSPGTPDTYQGCELWDLSLVDPDNRRPVDFAHRQRLLRELDASLESNRIDLCRKLVREPENGKIKLYVLSQGLRLRTRYPTVFKQGSYMPFDVVGPRAKNAIAFGRAHEGSWILAIVPRLVAGLVSRSAWDASVFEGTRVQLPEEAKLLQFKNTFTGEILSPVSFEGRLGLGLAQVWKEFPVSLLEP